MKVGSCRALAAPPREAAVPMPMMQRYAGRTTAQKLGIEAAATVQVIDAPREGFLTTMDVSVWSFIRMSHLAEPLMKNGGSLFTMTYYGSQMVVENYNIMGVAKAALESAVRYIAAEVGPKGIRVHAISPGPLATRAASGGRPRVTTREINAFRFSCSFPVSPLLH